MRKEMLSKLFFAVATVNMQANFGPVLTFECFRLRGQLLKMRHRIYCCYFDFIQLLPLDQVLFAGRYNFDTLCSYKLRKLVTQCTEENSCHCVLLLLRS